MRKAALRIFLFSSLLTCVFEPITRADSAPITLCVKPEASLPVSDVDLFQIGGGAVLSARFPLGDFPLQIGPDVGFMIQSLQKVSEFLTVVGIGGGAQLNLKITSWLQASPYVESGYYYSLAVGSGGGSLYVGAGLNVGLLLGPSFEIGLVRGYRFNIGLYQAAVIGLESRLLIGGGKAASTSSGEAQ